MNSTTLFSMALGLQAPWQVDDISFAADESKQKELHLHIGFLSGARFADASGAACPVHDTVEREWQHLNFFEHHCFLHCAVPRIKTTEGKVETVAVPWARPGSGFTLMFEAFAMALIEREMPVNRVAETRSSSFLMLTQSARMNAPRQDDERSFLRPRCFL
jgi:transposase